jgi:hypothetical protein
MIEAPPALDLCPLPADVAVQLHLPHGIEVWGVVPILLFFLLMSSEEMQRFLENLDFDTSRGCFGHEMTSRRQISLQLENVTFHWPQE